MEKRYQAKTDYILRKVAGSNVLISVGENIANFNGYVQLNETAAFLWEQLQEPIDIETLSESLTKEYEITREEADRAIKEFLNLLIQEGMASMS